MTIENFKKIVDTLIQPEELFTIQTTANAIFFADRVESIAYDGDIVIFKDKSSGQTFYVDCTDINIISTVRK